MPTTFHQWSTAEPFLRAMPSWVGDLDRIRIGTYQLYEEIYWSVREAFKISLRGNEGEPVYVPEPMTVVETMHRYLANDLSVLVQPAQDAEGVGDDALLEARLFWEAFAKRERFFSKFSSNKRYGIMRGDWLWHLYADPERPAGARISIYPLDPASYFPIYNLANVDEITGCNIVEHITDDEGEPFIRRLRYEKDTGTGGPARILVSDEVFEVDQWGGPGIEQGNRVRPDGYQGQQYTQQELPAEIQHLPVYHVPHFQETGTVWGSSELRGMERLVSSVNQSITDEDLALALEGLGLYTTMAGPPIDEETGDELPWRLGPGKVVELPEGNDFQRVNSNAGQAIAFQKHAEFLIGANREARGMSGAVVGRVEQTIAESGISLRLQMEPFIARVREKDQIVEDVHSNLLYDLRSWFRAYEGAGFMEAVDLLPLFGEKIPLNRQQEFANVMTMFKERVIDDATCREMLAKLGYTFPEDMSSRIDSMAQREADMFGNRLDRELAGAGEGE